MANPPLIFPLQEEGSPRPFWSVMIPTYNPQPDYLEETLRGILQQDPGPEQMQIEVVDDCSPDDTASEVVRRIGAGSGDVPCRTPKPRFGKYLESMH